MRVAWGLPAEKIEAWVLKTFNAFEVVRLGMQRYFSLSDFLKFNMIESKSGKGSDAIGLARKHKWKELGSYCLQDTKVTCILSTHDIIVVPMTYNEKAIVLERSNSSLFTLFS